MAEKNKLLSCVFSGGWERGLGAGAGEQPEDGKDNLLHNKAAPKE